MKQPFRFEAELWLWEGNAAWHFVTLPAKVSDAIEHQEMASGVPRRGFGSVRVEVTIEPTTWATSVFPDKTLGAYLLPVKKAVRAAAGVGTGDRVKISLRTLS